MFKNLSCCPNKIFCNHAERKVTKKEHFWNRKYLTHVDSAKSPINGVLPPDKKK